MNAEQKIATHFALAGTKLTVAEFGDGVINDTFLVYYTPAGSETKVKFILQKINKNVFPEPPKVMQNLRVLLDFITSKELTENNALLFPKIIPSNQNIDYHIDENGEYWRAISFIEGSQSFNTISNIEQARLAGECLGRFHNLVHDLPLKRIYDTLPGFHITPRYVQAFRKSLVVLSKRKSSAMLDHGIDFANQRLNSCAVLQDAIDDKRVMTRVIHGDPKLNNFLFNLKGDKVLSLIDLDTITPGLVHYDIADCLRSLCNRSGEDSSNIDKVSFDLDICVATLGAWMGEARNFMTLQDYQFIYPAVRLLPLELGLRFLTDYLGRNKYFKVEYPEQNLERAIVQFKLVYDIEQKEDEIQDIISQCL